MARVQHKIPTGLTVEDRFITYGSLSLSPRQFLLLLGGVAVGYGGMWKSLPGLPVPLRAGAALLPPLITLVFALVQPAGRPLEGWAFILARYWRQPRTSVWRPRAPQPTDWRPLDADWAGMAPQLAWSVAADTVTVRERGRQVRARAGIGRGAREEER